MKNVKYLAAGFVLLSVAAFASAGINVTVTAAIAPNHWGSPNWDAWDNNAISAMQNGLTTVGTPGTPGYYQAIASGTTLNYNTNVVTSGFNSWNGVANPTDSGAGESGSRVMFGVVVQATGNTTFSLNNLFWSMTDSPNTPADQDLSYGAKFDSFYSNCATYQDVNNYLSWYHPTGGSSFDVVGIGLDGQTITTGPLNQPLTALYFVGQGDAWEADGTPTTGQAALDTLDSELSGAGTISQYMNFNVFGSDLSVGSGQAYVNYGSNANPIAPVPVPAAVLLGIGGLSLVGLLRKRFAKSA
jgi:hypothetical protein